MALLLSAGYSFASTWENDCCNSGVAWLSGAPLGDFFCFIPFFFALVKLISIPFYIFLKCKFYVGEKSFSLLKRVVLILWVVVLPDVISLWQCDLFLFVENILLTFKYYSLTYSWLIFSGFLSINDEADVLFIWLRYYFFRKI